MICLLHVAICDDEETFVQHLNALLTRYAQETGIALKISTYRDGADLVDPYDASLDLIFLDIQMCAMDGLRAAEQIRKLDSKVAIIFLTTLTQYGLEGYQYQATNYIIKPLQYIRLKAEMDKFLARRQTEPDPFLLIVNDTGKYYERDGEHLAGTGVCPVSYQLPGESLFRKRGQKAGDHTGHRRNHPHQPAQTKGIYGAPDGILGGFAVILCLEVLSTILSLLYTFLFFWMLHTFLPVRKHWGLRIPAFLCFCYIADVIIYSNDLSNLLGVLVGFLLYVMLFHQGRWMAKAAAVLVFYPALIAINYLMLDTSSRLFFSFTGASGDSSLIPWSPEDYLWSTLFHTAALFLRLLFWALAWFCLRRYLGQISASLTSSMWLIVDTLMLAPFVAIFTILCFLPENIAIVYPICFASIFSSFGCIYLAAYICTSVQTTYRAQALEKQKTYYKDRLQDEERVRQIYHDMKNHLLVLQSQSENSPVLHQAAQTLQDQLQAYESYQHTGNEYLDAIIRDKARLAREKSIDFTSVIHFEAGHFLDPLDISTLFGNALDNAIEACMQLPDAQRLVTVKTSRVRDMLLVLVENTMSSSLVWNGRTTKEDPFLHGFGLANIQRTVEKYGGHCLTHGKDGIFTLKILLPIPS